MDHPNGQLSAGNHNRDLLTAAIGTTVGYHVSQCKAGGYIVVVDGAVHAACTTLVEAVEAMGRVAAGLYSETATRPEQATDVTPPAGAPVEDDPLPGPRPRVLRPVQAGVKPPDLDGFKARHTVSLVLVAFAVLAGSIWGA